MTGPPDDASERFVVHPAPELAAIVRIAAVPDIPFASFAQALQPLLDEQGELVDWVLTSAVLDPAPTRGVSVGDYWAWRRCWEQRYWLGPVTNAVALVTHTGRLAGTADGPLDELLPMDALLTGIDADVVVGELEHALASVATAPPAGEHGWRKRPGLHRRHPPQARSAGPRSNLVPDRRR